ncbi:MAG: hypothetical protein EA397_17370 [Deltaproteobacteria bacterium]|nr:MAG: hypothetical protein EA397_17370 [Deltaproteobacteria bacterium]
MDGLLDRPVASDLDELEQLDRSLLHVFVAGPGTGEGIAIALPGPDLGWILIDGCRCTPDPSDEELSVRWVLRKFRMEPIRWRLTR